MLLKELLACVAIVMLISTSIITTVIMVKGKKNENEGKDVKAFLIGIAIFLLIAMLFVISGEYKVEVYKWEIIEELIAKLK